MVLKLMFLTLKVQLTKKAISEIYLLLKNILENLRKRMSSFLRNKETNVVFKTVNTLGKPIKK